VANKSNAKMGRPPGSKNKQTVGMLLAQRKGISPLEFLLSVMDDEELDLKMRIDAAKAACPFIHPRLSAVQVENKPWDGDPNVITNKELAAIINCEQEDQVH
jgi:hypothetical protein